MKLINKIKKKFDFNGFVLFWICISILFIWLILKELGYINTPDLIKIIPYFMGFGALVGMTKEIGKFIHKLGEYGNKIDTLVKDVSEIKKDLHSLDKRVTVLESIQITSSTILKVLK